MDSIQPIGPPGQEAHPVERVTRRDLEEEEAGRREERRHARREHSARPEEEPEGAQEPRPEDGDSPHVDVRA